MTCPRLDQVVDHAFDLRSVTGLSDHVVQCDECRRLLRVLKEVEYVRATEVPERVSQLAMDAVTALWLEQQARARPSEIWVTGLLGGLTVATITLVAGTLGAEGNLLPLAATTLAGAVGAAWWESRTVEDTTVAANP